MSSEQLNLFSNYRELILPIFTYPKEDELFTSWIIRLAHDHRVKAFTFSNLVFKEKGFWKIDKDKSASKANLLALGLRTDIDLKTIFDTTLKSYEGRLATEISHSRLRTWIMPQVRIKGLISVNFISFCPICLKKESVPYFKKKWRLALSFCCPHCNCLLKDCCPQCNKPIMFHHHTFGVTKKIGPSMKYCYNCLIDLSSTEATKPQKHELENQKYLYDLLDHGYNSQFSYSHLYFDGLLHICQLLISSQTQAISKAIEKELSISLQVNKEALQFCSLSLGDRCRILNAAIWLLQEWPDRFITVCKRHNLYYFHFFRKKIVTPYWLYSIVKNELFHGRGNFHLPQVKR